MPGSIVCAWPRGTTTAVMDESGAEVVAFIGDDVDPGCSAGIVVAAGRHPGRPHETWLVIAGRFGWSSSLGLEVVG